ncbi:MAG: stage 0 sporulation family protein [Anaerolineaceae bacterium]|nr:stage 0 sporulation family protein [Anaerolineaceae bacterium]
MTNYASVAGVRFVNVGKIYHFDSSAFPELRSGDAVIVETSRGWQIGRVAQVLEGHTTQGDAKLKSIERLATPRDLILRQQWEAKEQDVLAYGKKRSKELSLKGVKIVFAEYSFDGSRLTILFNAENEDKVELKSLRQDMQKAYAPAQVELRQIGPRDVAKTLCGMGACGLETRCCSQFLCDFNSISIRMAKEQGVSLTPTEITGMCGRLRCCLIYEYETYATAHKKLPKKNKRVMTPRGEGKVVDISALSETVTVQMDDNTQHKFSSDEIQILEGENVGSPKNPPVQPRNPERKRR